MDEKHVAAMVSCLCEGELEAAGDWWAIYKRSFPEEEREPPEVIRRSLRDGVGAALRASLQGRTVGIATIHLLLNPPAVFLVYLAVDPPCQGQGVGRELFEAAWEVGRQLLRERGLTAEGIVWEVERREETSDPEETLLRERRIQFFARLGGVALPCRYQQPPVDGSRRVPMVLMFRGGTIPEKEKTLLLANCVYHEKYGRVNGIPEEILNEMLQELEESMTPLCESCSTRVPEEEAEEFMGCDDAPLLLCRECANVAWGIPEIFTGQLGLLKSRALRLIRQRSHAAVT